MKRTVKEIAERAKAGAALLEGMEADALKDIAEMLDLESIVTDYYKAAKEFALMKAKDGVSIPGYKLVRGMTKRRVIDPEGLMFVLEMEGLEEKDLYVRQAKSLTELEKLVGKKTFAELSAGMVEKPEGELKLVKESDKGEAVNPLASLISQFD